jgi:hypothetical protein
MFGLWYNGPNKIGFPNTARYPELAGDTQIDANQQFPRQAIQRDPVLKAYLHFSCPKMSF